MTVECNKVPAWLSDNNEATDMQVVLRLLTLMEGQGETGNDPFKTGLKRMYIEIAEDALKSMTNPMAKALLAKQIGSCPPAAGLRPVARRPS